MGDNRDRRAVLVLSLFVLQSDYYQLVLTYVLLWAVLSLAWNILSGYAGYFSFGHAVFWGLGAYTVALGMMWFHLTPWLRSRSRAVVGAVAGAMIGYPTFRLRGHYFALAMLAYPLAMLYVFQWLGYQELVLPMKREAPLLYMQFADRRVYVVLALALLVIALLISLWVENSRFGMALTAIKQNEPAAEAAGINTWRWKMLALMLSGALAAVAGGLYGVVMLVVTPESVFGMLVSAQALILALFGGVGSLWGPVIGAAVLVPLAEGLNAELGAMLPGIQGVVYGVAIIAIILLAPEGVYWRVRDRLSPSDGARPRCRAPPSRCRRPPKPARLRRRCCARRWRRGAICWYCAISGFRSAGCGRSTGSTSSCPRAGCTGSSARTAPARRRCSTSSTGFWPPTAARSLCRGADHRAAAEPGVPPRHRPHLSGRARLPAHDGARKRHRRRVCRRADDATARRMALAALDRVGLSRRGRKLAGGLTTRELRLMELARALVPHPRS